MGGACGRGRTATNRTRRNKSNTTPHNTAEVLVSTEPPDDNPGETLPAVLRLGSYSFHVCLGEGAEFG